MNLESLLLSGYLESSVFNRWVAGIALGATAWACPVSALAVDVLQHGYSRSAFQLPDVEFEVKPKSLGMFVSIPNTLLVPEGNGPFPVVVLSHSCGGIGPPIRRWAEFFLAQGFAVYPLDSFGPRGIQRCGGPASAMRGAKDALDLLPKLKKEPLVDPQRVALVGFSWGGEVATLVISPAVEQFLKATDRYSAAISIYSSCIIPERQIAGRTVSETHLLREDVDRPYLLLASRNDPETPAAACVAYMDALKAKGLPVEYHLYDGVTHTWDAPEYRQGTGRDGKPFPYVYSSSVTEDSRQRALAFLRSQLRMPR